MFGEKALGFIDEYAGNKNTDGDVATYFGHLYGFGVASTAIWNARKALAGLLGKAYSYYSDTPKPVPRKTHQAENFVDRLIL